MLTLLFGRAGSGKTSYIMQEIRQRVEAREPQSILIVPEQFSHDAERELAATCPDYASLYAEVLSFTRLASRVFQEMGGLAEKSLDKGGRILAMSRAVSETMDHLKLYSFGGNKSDFLENLLTTYDELRASLATSQILADAAEKAPPGLDMKLQDLATIFEAYDQIKERSGLDPRDRLEQMLDKLEESSVGKGGHIYLDGFTDFTRQESLVIDIFLKKDIPVTVALGCDEMSDDLVFRLPNATARSLQEMAKERGVVCRIVKMGQEDSSRPPDLQYLERALFDYTAKPFEGTAEHISLWHAETLAKECSLAAAQVIRLVKNGARYRDIAVVSPTWDEYASMLMGIFRQYGIPVNASEKTDVLSRPVMAYVSGALDVVLNNWDYADLFRVIKTGLSGLTADDGDLLENYVLKWNLRGKNAWLREEDWAMPPGGYAESISEEDRAVLQRINQARRTVALPLQFLQEHLKSAATAVQKAQALYDFLEKAELYGKLEEKVAALRQEGELRLAAEYAQLWDALIKALTQFAGILHDLPLEDHELNRLIKLVLGQYELATIPTSVDSVGVGDMTRMRGRGVRHLILIGATDTALPRIASPGGILTDADRIQIRSLGLELPDPEDDTLARELGIAYASLTMPSQSLTLSYPTFSRPSYLLSRLETLFKVPDRDVGNDVYLESVPTALELAASGEGEEAALSAAYFFSDERYKDELRILKDAARMPRGRLSRMTAERLYGRSIGVTASRLDKFYACRFAYFLQYGLKLKPRKEAGLDAPEVGTFIHDVLEKTTRAVSERGGFGKVTDEELRELSRLYAADYAERKLGGLKAHSGRFKYLFSRLCQDAERIVLNMAEELRHSSFQPLDFELTFDSRGDLPPISIEGEEGPVQIHGVVDRVDGWVRNDRLYLRVVDYKTGKKSFRLSDILYGQSLQMLVYLFALGREGGMRYAKEIVPAGVLYAPARDPIISSDSRLSDEDARKERLKAIRRSGLIMDDADVIYAMENSDKPVYIPVKYRKDGAPYGDSLVSLEELGALSRHIDMLVAQMGDEVRKGSVTADPYFRSNQDNACLYCDYFGACHFQTGQTGDRPRFLSSLSSPEAMARMMEEVHE